MNKFFFAVVAFAAFCLVSVQCGNDNKVPSPNPQKQSLLVNNLAQQINLPEGTWASVVYKNEFWPEDDDCDALARVGNFSYLSNWIPVTVQSICTGCTKKTDRDGLCTENRLVWNGTQNGPFGMNIYASIDTSLFRGKNEPIVATINWQEVPPQGYFLDNGQPVTTDLYTVNWLYTGAVTKKEKTVSYQLQLTLRFWNGNANEVDDSPYTIKYEWGNGEVSTGTYTFVPASNWYVATAQRTYNWRVGLGNPGSVTFNGRVTITDKDKSVLVKPFRLILKRR